MMIVPLAEPVSMNVPLRRYQRAISIKSILISALIAEHALMYARQRLFILHSYFTISKDKKGCTTTYSPFYFYSFTFLSLRELVITDTELKLIARAAIIGDNNIPKNG